MDSDGRILSQGSLANVLEHDSHLVKEVIEEREEIEKAEIDANFEKPEDAMAKQTAGKLVVDEEIEVGHVGWTARMSSRKCFLSGNELTSSGSQAIPRKHVEPTCFVLARLCREPDIPPCPHELTGEHHS